MGNLYDSTVNQDKIDFDQAKSVILKHLKSENKPLTKADIQSATGYSLYITEDVLYEILKEYPCRLEVNEKGQIVYVFNFEEPTQKGLLGRYFNKLFYFTKNLLLFIAKLIITLVFFSYALTAGVFAAVLISALAKSAQPLIALGLGLAASVHMLFADLSSFFSGKKVVHDPYNRKNLINMLFVFAFGYTPEKDETEREKLLLHFIRTHNCKITAGDVVALTGASLEKAGEELTMMLTHYRGQVYVSEKGIIIYHFPEFEKEKTKEQKTEKRTKDFFCWNNPHSEKPYVYRNDSPYKWINGIAIFSLVASLITFLIVRSMYNITVSDWWYVLSFRTETMLGLPPDSGKIVIAAFYLAAFFIFMLFAAYLSKKRDHRRLRSLRSENKHFERLKIIFAEMPSVDTAYFPELSDDERFDLAYKYRAELKIKESDASLYYDFSVLADEIHSAEAERSLRYPRIVNNAPSGRSMYVEKNIASPKVRRRRFRVKHAVWIIIFVIIGAVIWFYNDITAINRTRNITKFDRNAKLIVDHASPLFRFVDTRKYKYFGTIIAKNASEKHPFMFTDTVVYTEGIELRGSNALILPKHMPQLKSILAYDIEGEIRLPEEMPYLYEAYFKDISSALCFPEQCSSLRYLSIVNSRSDSLVLPRYGSSLDVLELDSCRLSAVPFLDGFHGLKELRLPRNQIAFLPDSFPDFDGIHTMDFSHNDLQSIPDSSFSNISLNHLDLSHNQLVEIHFESLANVFELNLSHNRIVKVDEYFRHTEASYIWLEYNKLESLPTPDTLCNVFELYLDNNNLSELPDSLHLFENLRELSLAHNKFKELPERISNFPKLNYLNLNYNQLEFLPQSMAGMELRKLQLAGNPIKEVPENFKELSKTCTFVISKRMSDDVLQQFKQICGVDQIEYSESIRINKR